jgi:peptidyl-prolyl cis-trans isomerase C
MTLLKSNRALGLLVALFLVAFAWTAQGQEKSEEKKDAKSPVAIVNGTAIERFTYDREMNLYKQRLARSGRQLSESDNKDAEKALLDDLINRELLYQESVKKGIKIETKAVDDQYAAIRERYPDDAKFKEVLERMNLDEAMLKVQIGHQTAVQQLIESQISPKVTIKDDETKAFYDANPSFFKTPEQVKASHILIKFDPKTADEAKKTSAKKSLTAAKERLTKGEDFAALAKEISDDPSKANDGDLGYFRRGQMVKPFEDAAFSLQPNAVSDIVETQFGYHLIKVYDKKPEGVLAFDEVKDRIAQQLREDKLKQEVMEYIKELRKSAKIQSML